MTVSWKGWNTSENAQDLSSQGQSWFPALCPNFSGQKKASTELLQVLFFLKQFIFRSFVSQCKGTINNWLRIILFTVEKEHAVNMDLFVYIKYIKFHSRNICQVIVFSRIKSPKIHTHFSLEVKMVEILTDLNWKWNWGSENIQPLQVRIPCFSSTVLLNQTAHGGKLILFGWK